MERGKIYKASTNIKVGECSNSTGGSGISSTKYCGCGIRARICTSSNGKTVGRKFYGCSNYGKESFCGFFEWIDTMNKLEDAENLQSLLNMKNTGVELHMMRAKTHDLEVQVAKLTKKNVKLKNDLKSLKDKLRILETREKWFVLVIGLVFILFMSLCKNMF